MATTENSLSAPGTSPLAFTGEAVAARAAPDEVGGPPTLPGQTMATRPVVDEATRSSGVLKSKTPRRRRTRHSGSAGALKMLTLHPVFAIPVPRHHVEPRGPDGSRLVHDRATSELFVVYSPRFVDQFRAGHHSGLWYLRATSDVGATPRSVGFATARAAVEAVRAGQWKLANSHADQSHAGRRCRVIWS